MRQLAHADIGIADMMLCKQLMQDVAIKLHATEIRRTCAWVWGGSPINGAMSTAGVTGATGKLDRTPNRASRCVAWAV